LNNVVVQFHVLVMDDSETSKTNSKGEKFVKKSRRPVRYIITYRDYFVEFNSDEFNYNWQLYPSETRCIFSHVKLYSNFVKI
jgi:hypothetical protein